MKRQYSLYLIFFFSGLGGLIYESVWTHYLKLFLGSAAYAQALVLGLFMGGLALGAWLSNRFLHRWKKSTDRLCSGGIDYRCCRLTLS